MSSRRSLIPPPGNSARPVFLVIAGFFGIMLVGYPIFMYAVGLDTDSIVWITLLIGLIAAGALWFTSYYGRNLQRDQTRLDAGEVWAEWTVPDASYRRFVANERRGANRLAVAYAVGAIILGLGLGWLENDRLLGGIMLVALLFATLVTLLFAGPPRSARRADARQVKIGPRGVRVMGQYMPFAGTLMRLQSVEVSTGDPAVMRFRVRAGRRTDELRVPVAPDRVDDAHALAERFRREHHLPQG